MILLNIFPDAKAIKLQGTGLSKSEHTQMLFQELKKSHLKPITLQVCRVTSCYREGILILFADSPLAMKLKTKLGITIEQFIKI